jgi:hypothetical protein
LRDTHRSKTNKREVKASDEKGDCRAYFFGRSPMRRGLSNAAQMGAVKLSTCASLRGSSDTAHRKPPIAPKPNMPRTSSNFRLGHTEIHQMTPRFLSIWHGQRCYNLSPLPTATLPLSNLKKTKLRETHRETFLSSEIVRECRS